MAQHGVKKVFEIVGEQQVTDGHVAVAHAGFRFGRLFPNLPPFQPTDTALSALGNEITSAPELPNSDIPSGYTYFGQFVDHDVTKDDTSDRPETLPPAGVPFDQLIQKRSPSLDLDSVYGKTWPDVDPLLLQSDGVQMLLGNTTPVGTLGVEKDADLPRKLTAADPKDVGEAIIGDPRNDENLIIQQLHLAFLKFHNAIARQIRLGAPSDPAAVVLLRTRELVTLHYQWIVLNDFVRRIVSPETFQSVLGVANLAGVNSVSPNVVIFPVIGTETPPMPLEFSAAAYRFGHSMVRETYSWNKFSPMRSSTFSSNSRICPAASVTACSAPSCRRFPATGSPTGAACSRWRRCMGSLRSIAQPFR